MRLILQSSATQVLQQSPPAPPATLFPDEGFDDSANFNFANAGGKASVAGGLFVANNFTSSQYVLLATGPNADMLAQLENGVQYDVTVNCTTRAGGSLSMSLKGGTPAVVASVAGTAVVTLTAGSSATEAWRAIGSGNVISGSAVLSVTSCVVAPHV